jgi:hypothetical protein
MKQRPATISSARACSALVSASAGMADRAAKAAIAAGMEGK